MGKAWVTAVAAVGVAVGAVAAAPPAQAEEVTVEMNRVTDEGVGAAIGTVTATDSEHGLILAFDLKDLLPGPHRFNIHDSPSCEPGEIEGQVRAAGAAGARWQAASAAGGSDPNDFPVIYVQVDEDGARPYKRSIVAPGLTVADLRGHALVLHSHRDNYRYEGPRLSDGRGPRVACGVVG